MKISLRCTACNELVQNIPEEDRPQRCPRCKQPALEVFNRGDGDIPMIRRTIRSKTRRGNKVLWESKEEDQFFRKTGTWHKRFMLIDKQEDRIIEKCTHPVTGEITFQKEGKLSDHRGHGDAKKSANKQIQPIAGKPGSG